MTDLFTVGKTSAITSAEGVTMANKCMTYNVQTGEALGVVGTDYQIMQPQECYDLVEATCGSVSNVRWDGKTMIMQGKAGGMLLRGDDEVQNMFTIINSFDGTSALHGMALTFRIFCSNQLRSAFAESKASNSRTTIRHSGDWDAKLESFKKAFQLLRTGHQKFVENVTTLAQRNVTPNDIETLWKAVAPTVCKLTKKDLETESGALKIKAFVNHATQTYESERALGCPDSMWLAANAVTKYVQHAVAKRGRKADQDRRFVDNAVGVRADTSAFVMRKALEMV